MSQPASPTRRSILLGLALAGSVTQAFAQTTSAPLEANKAVVRRVIEEVQRDGNFANFEKLFASG
ncbi:MAG: ester cyclase, partial [Afipia sp.]